MSTLTVSSTAGLAQALKVAQAGDTIALQSGTYSGVVVSNLNFGSGITITSADPNQQAVLTDLKVSNSQGLNFSQLELTTEFAKGDNPFQVLSSQNVQFDGMNVHGSLDGDSSNDVAAFLVRNSSDVGIHNSEFQQLLFGIGTLDSQKLVISGNNFHDMRSDGIRGGNVSQVEITDNTFTNFRPLAGDHPDAIQFWTTNTTVSSHDILISGNVITRGDGATIQGIFLGDESNGKLPYLNVTITDNLLVGTGFNGITLTGRGGVISDNVLVSFTDEATRVRVQNSSDVIVSGNAASDYVYINLTNVTKIDNEVNTAVTDFGKAAIEQRVIDHEWVSTNNYDGNRVDLFSFEPKFSQGILSLYQFQIPDGYIF